jgi:hypothetical protein
VTGTTPTGSSPYSTGGGGVKFEHEVAGRMLASLLLGVPVEGLGEDFTPTRVALQQERYSPVDDVHVDGLGPGGERTLRVACRRHPTLAKSEESTVKMFADFVAVVLDEAPLLDADRVRFGLAVAAPFTPAAELATLTEVARRQTTRAAYADAINARGAYTAAVRARLTYVDQLVEAALGHLKRTAEIAPEECAWRLLRSLYVLELQLEGDAAPARTDVVARLTRLTGDAARANDLRLRLNDIGAALGTRAGGQTRASLRRDLRGFGPLGPSEDFSRAATQLATLVQALERDTPRALSTPGTGGAAGAFVLDRPKEVQALVDAIDTAAPGSVILLRGEADVGKSALALATMDQVRAAGGAVLALSLRDLPASLAMLTPSLGLAPETLLAAAPSAPVSVLLLDGGEVVQEGNAAVAGALLDATAAVGRTAIIVARDDAADAVRDLVQRHVGTVPVEQIVPSLGDDDVTRVVAAAPALARYAADTRAVWLLRRLGLVDLLLRAAQNGALLPSALASEAEVFATVWHALVRRAERVIAGVGPDDREQATLDIARELLGGGLARPVPGGVLASLRSDNVLRPRDATTAWQTRDQFASDVLRDFATARLLLRERLPVLLQGGAPRWAVRAARLFAQARLAEVAGGTGTPDPLIAARWTEVTEAFSALVAEHGARWAELPWEALFTAGWAERVLTALTPQLRAEATALATAMECIERRFSALGGTDPIVAAPLVAWIVNAGLLAKPRQYRDNPVESFVRAWLWGLVRHQGDGGDVAPFRTLRSQVRDALLSRTIEPGEGTRLECLAVLGEESDDRSTAVLREVARNSSHSLGPVVESFYVASSLARHDGGLLADLAEAYYLERAPKGREARGWISALDVDAGIRHHHGGGWNTPLAAFYRGPFLLLFRSHGHFLRALALLNRMLERGATQRALVLAGTEDAVPVPAPGVDLDLLGLGPRRYLGDAHVWQWYRGSSVGPYPCMSGLMALELVLDDFVRAGAGPGEVAQAVLRDATTLASVSLVFGFLVRHLDRVNAELDGFLASPGVWQLEFNRAVSEGRLHVQRSDPEALTGREQRRWTPREVAGMLVVRALARGDEAALERLRGVGERLIDAAGGTAAPPTVRQWAVSLDSRNYVERRVGDTVAYEVVEPPEIVSALDGERSHTEQMNEMFRLLQRYRIVNVLPYRHASPELPDTPTLTADVRTAHALVEAIGEEDPLLLIEAVAGVAAAALDAAAQGQAVASEDLRWAVAELTDMSDTGPAERSASDLTVHESGADRRAALVLPLTLVLPADTRAALGAPSPNAGPEHGEAPEPSPETSLDTIRRALVETARSEALEVRAFAMEGLRAVFTQPCAVIADGTCAHEVAFQALEAGARRVVLGAWDATSGRRGLADLAGSVTESLPRILPRDLMLSHIVVAATGAMSAVRAACVRARAEVLRDELLRAYARAAPRWARENYSWREEYHAAFASAVLEWAVTDGPTVVSSLIEALGASPGAIASVLQALAIVATYEPAAASALALAWPAVMARGLAVLDVTVNTARSDGPDDQLSGESDAGERGTEDRRDAGDKELLVRVLVPAPSPMTSTPDIGTVIDTARHHWLPLGAVTEAMPQWIEHARGERWCVDALVGFLRAQPLRAQVSPGLAWVRDLIIAKNGTARTSGFLLVSWLGEVRDSGALDADRWPDYRILVDALALGGFDGARDLQQRDE